MHMPVYAEEARGLFAASGPSEEGFTTCSSLRIVLQGHGFSDKQVFDYVCMCVCVCIYEKLMYTDMLYA